MAVQETTNKLEKCVLVFKTAFRNLFFAGKTCLTVQLDVQDDTQQWQGAQDPAESGPPTRIHHWNYSHFDAGTSELSGSAFTSSGNTNLFHWNDGLCFNLRPPCRNAGTATAVSRRDGILVTVPVWQYSVLKCRHAAERFPLKLLRSN